MIDNLIIEQFGDFESANKLVLSLLSDQANKIKEVIEKVKEMTSHSRKY